MTEKEIVEKKTEIMDLLFKVTGVSYEVDTYFDVESDNMLDEKIEVLTALREGKSISEIPKFYEVLELMPQDGEMWD